jgi:5-oxoprolinase (ATP-hydrolysing)
MTVTVLSSHRVTAPAGAQGGGNGASGINTVARADGTQIALDGNDQIALNPGDVFCMHTPGGGGFGSIS